MVPTGTTPGGLNGEEPLHFHLHNLTLEEVCADSTTTKGLIHFSFYRWAVFDLNTHEHYTKNWLHSCLVRSVDNAAR